MATSDVQIVNVALTLLGEARIISLNDDVKPAREAKAVYEFTRDALIAGYTWSFAKTRTSLPASATAPAFGFQNAFPLPVDCLRIIFVGDYFVGADMTNYRGAPTEEFVIEGREILTDWSAPLNLQYGKRVTDPTLFHQSFAMALAAALARDMAEALTKSGSKRDRAQARFKEEISTAVRANAIELPPRPLADDQWLLSRL